MVGESTEGKEASSKLINVPFIWQAWTNWLV